MPGLLPMLLNPTNILWTSAEERPQADAPQADAPASSAIAPGPQAGQMAQDPTLATQIHGFWTDPGAPIDLRRPLPDPYQQFLDGYGPDGGLGMCRPDSPLARLQFRQMVEDRTEQDRIDRSRPRLEQDTRTEEERQHQKEERERAEERARCLQGRPNGQEAYVNQCHGDQPHIENEGTPHVVPMRR